MPTYEYVCSKCDHHFEKVQRMSDKTLTVCPKELCPRKPWGKGKVKRQMSAGAGLIFKGSGFYITDYRSEGYKADAKKDSGATTSSGSTDTAKKETKTTESKGEKASGSPPPASTSSKSD